MPLELKFPVDLPFDAQSKMRDKKVIFHLK
jgi:hypothetical protein